MKTLKRPIRAKKKVKKAEKPQREGVLVAFLLDRSGSMSVCRDETISGFNGYLSELLKKKEAKDMLFTLTQFDSQGIDVIHDAVPLKDVNKLTVKTFQPRGSTPLYDSIGKTVWSVDKIANKRNILFVTLTDGQENASCEWRMDSIRDLIKDREAKGWTFAHIGVGIDGFAATSAYSIGTMSASNNMSSAVGDSARRFRKMASATAAYCATSAMAGGQTVNSLTGIWDKDDEGE